MKGIREILSTKTASIVCVLFALANRIIFTTLNSLIGTDTKIQLVYAETLVEGKKIGITKYFTNDLANPVLDHQQIFPPGFSITIIPFLKIYGGNEIRAVLAFDILVAVFFILAVRRLGNKIGLNPFYNNTATIMAGGIQYLFFSSWSSTDAISLCLIIVGLSITITIISKIKRPGLLHVLGAGLIFSLPFFFRFMYLPIAVLLPFFIILYGYFLKEKELKFTGFKVLAASILFLLAQLTFSLSISDNALFVQDFGRGLFFGQLTKWYPFLPASFINLDFAAQLIEKFTHVPYSRTILLAQILNLALFILLMILFIRFIISQKQKNDTTPVSIFIVIGSFIALLIVCLIAYLTLTYKAIPWGYQLWTHSQHARYYAYLYFFLPFLLIAYIQYCKPFSKNILIRSMVFLLLCCITIETLHGIYYNAKILEGSKDLSIIKDSDAGYRAFPGFIENIKKQNPDKKLLVSSPDHYYLYAASQMGLIAIFDYENLSKDAISFPQNSILIIPVHENESSFLKNYLEKRKPQLALTISGTYFYTKEINSK